MKHILTFAALVFAITCFGQAPTGEMENELLAWFPFSNNTFDASGNGNHAVLSGPESFSEGLYGEAIYLSDANYMSIDNLLASGLTEFSCFAMVKLQQNLYADIAGDWGSSFLLRYVPSEGWALNVNGSDGSIHIMSGITPNWATWNRVGFVHDEEGLRLYVNGEVVASSAGNYFGTIYASSAIMTMGAQENQGTMNGWIDDVKMWSRGLSHDEVNALENNIPNSVGCMDSTACNFSPEVIFDDGSCHFNCQFCDDGTVWDEDVFKCVVANPSDTDFDGCVSMTDLLDLLSVFGTCNEVPWSCGDPLEYQGYNYETVQIGEQCWFAENLRTSSFSDGTPVYELQSSEDWMNANDGFPAWCYYENNPAHSHSLYGKLYNWNVVWSSLLGPAFNICPSGWSVPTSQQWVDLATSAGDLYHEGTALKAAPDDTPSWNGTNTSGFNGLPGGRRDETGSWSFGGTMGMWWSSSPSSEAPEKAWYFQLSGSSTGYNGGFSDKTSGMSIRCIQDSE